MTRVAVALESGAKRAFAIALDWPGWARSGRNEEEALANLADYAARYARAVSEPPLARNPAFDVVERLHGGSGTDFGVPSAEAKADAAGLPSAAAGRQRRLLEAAWRAFDEAARAAHGRELRTGPRGGGRNLDKMTSHVLEAEVAYLSQLGSRQPKPPANDVAARMAQVRRAALDAFAARSRGEEPADPSGVKRRWSPRYYVRRAAWHALDHTWELEDRLT